MPQFHKQIKEIPYDQNLALGFIALYILTNEWHTQKADLKIER
jgi:hypothetical protein